MFNSIKITENIITQKSNQNTTEGFQPQTQSIFVNINPNIKNIETIESLSPTEVTGISILTNSELIPGITIPLQIPT